MAKRKRDVPVLFWVSAEELELIRQKMQQYGTENLSAYLRKMAVDGYVAVSYTHLDVYKRQPLRTGSGETQRDARLW